MDKNQETQEIVDNLTKGIEAAKDMRTVLQAQLASEPEKPKLRHGDYGTYIEGEPRLVILGKVYDKRGMCGNVKYDDCYTIHGNFFDDLAATSEPLEEFKMPNGAKVSINEYGHLKITDGLDYTIISKNDIHDFILNLRRMEATLKAKQDEKGAE